MPDVGKAEHPVRHVISSHAVTARTERQTTTEFLNAGVVLAKKLLRRNCDLMRPLAINPARSQFTPAPGHGGRLRAAGEIVGHLPKCLENDRLFELAKLKAARARKSDCAGIALIARHCFGAPDGGGPVRAFDGLSWRQSTFDMAERQGDVVDHRRTPTLSIVRPLRT